MARVTGDGHRRLPPAQYVARGWPVMHYGRVPRWRPDTWDLRVVGATASGEERVFRLTDLDGLPTATVRADFHCVTKFSVLDNEWHGVLASTLLAEVPPSADVTHVLAWAEYGYSANLRLSDLARPTTVLATARNGEPLTPEHGAPLRLVVPHLYAWKGPKWLRGLEYLTADRRGFWEERGYHNVADPWLGPTGQQGQRYSYQEEPGDGPPLRR